MGSRAKVLLPLILAGALLAAALLGAARAPMVTPLLVGIALLLLALAGWNAELALLRPLERLKAMLRKLTAQQTSSVAPGPEDEFAVELAQVRALIQGYEARLTAEAARNEQLDRALREADERYATAVRCASDGIWEWDLKTGHMHLSPSWKSMLGFGDAELQQSHAEWRECVHADDLGAVEAALAAHLDGKVANYNHVYRLRHKDGGYRWILSRGAAIRHASGKAYRMVGLDTDITRLKRVEKILGEIVDGTSGAFGEAFFRAMVRHFAGALDVHSAFITECADQPPTRLRTLAFWAKDDFLDNFEYDLPGTPCEQVIKEGKACFLPSGVGSLFPIESGYEGYLGLPIFGSAGQVIGHLAFLDRETMGEDMLVDAVYRVFTSRAGAELERKMALEALHGKMTSH